MSGPPASSLPCQPSTHLPSINTFGDLSQFLREAVADEDSRLLSEGMARVASEAERVIRVLRQDRARAHAAPHLVDMLTALRDHRALVVGLGIGWRGLYEYAGYLHALNNFRVLIGQWLLNVDPWEDQLGVSAEEFELIAWRTLGEGMLLIDMYEQWLRREGEATDAGLDESQPPRVARALQWWQRLRR